MTEQEFKVFAEKVKSGKSRKWESKSMKANIDYIKKQLKQFGLNAPKYLTTNKKLTQKQIQTQTKRIIKEIDNQIYKPKIKTMEEAMEELRKVGVRSLLVSVILWIIITIVSLAAISMGIWYISPEILN